MQSAFQQSQSTIDGTKSSAFGNIALIIFTLALGIPVFLGVVDAVTR